MHYLKGTVNLGLFYKYDALSTLIDFADACYRSDPHKKRSQTNYMYTYGGTTIS